MGFFSYFFSNEDEDDEEVTPETEDQESEEYSPTDELFDGMRLDVTNKQGEPLFSGRIASRTHDTLTLDRLPGDLSFPILPINSELNINGFDKKLLPICLSATVQQSSRIILVLKDLALENHAENRASFRLPYNAPVSLYRADDERLRNPEPCRLINVSTGGCCLESEYIHVENEVVRVSLELTEYAPLTYLGQITRGEERTPGIFRYGILFAQLTEQEISLLNRTMFNLQVNIKGTHQRSE